MTTKAGVWIDHRKAFVVFLANNGEQTHEILSDPDSAPQPPGEVRVKHSYTPNDYVAEDKLERKEMIHLNHYYDEVIALLSEAETILVFGPGEAKGEFSKRLEGEHLKGRKVEIKTTDKLTDHQIAEYVREHFQGT